MLAAITDIRAEGEVRESHYGRATVQRTPTDDTSSTTGGRTFRTATVTDAISSSKARISYATPVGQGLEQQVLALGGRTTGKGQDVGVIGRLGDVVVDRRHFEGPDQLEVEDQRLGARSFLAQDPHDGADAEFAQFNDVIHALTSGKSKSTVLPSGPIERLNSRSTYAMARGTVGTR